MKSKRLTAIFRDHGCGMRPDQLPKTIFHLGGKLKEDRLWQQGAFGLGGALTYRNAQAVVLVSRRDPALLTPGEPDEITVAVVLWKHNVKGRGAYYLVTTPWHEAGNIAVPWSCPAHEVPEFEPGSHLALISYGVDGIHRKRQGDERSFDTIANTRLFKPVMPVRFRNDMTGKVTTLLGLQKKLVEDHGEQIPTQNLPVPFAHSGKTYELPHDYYLFSSSESRRSFVAHDHVVVFTSNGQIQHHWTRAEFRARTNLQKLSDRVLVVVETDALPIDVRTSLFTADRTSLVRTDAAVRLEDTVAAALNDWDYLQEENNKLIREGLRGSNEHTLDIALRISRILDAKGFQPGQGEGSSGGSGGTGGGGGGEPGRARVIELRADPTYIDGPVNRVMQIGRTSFMTIYIDAEDEFWDRQRGQLRIDCDHAEIGQQEITYGKGRRGRVKLSVAVPETAVPGTEELRVTLEGWHRAAGGLGPALAYTCKLELATEIPGRGSGSGKPGGGDTGRQGPARGKQVALHWTSPDKEEAWNRMTVGEVRELRAVDIAAMLSEYVELGKLGDERLSVIYLNQEYPPFKKYLTSRSKKLVELNRPKETYAVGVGVELVIIQQEITRRQEKKMSPIDDEFIGRAQHAAAQAVLAVMPAADELAKQAGLDRE